MKLKLPAKGLPYLFLLLIFAGCTQPKALTLKAVNSFSVSTVSLSKSLIKFNAAVVNPNKFEILVKQVDAEIELEGKKLGSITLQNEINIPGSHSEYSIPVEFEAQNSVLLSAVVSGIFKDSIPYKFSGFIKAGRNKVIIRFPFNYSGRISPKMLR